MPRIARKISDTGVYHAMIRGINRQNIFQDNQDRIVFIEKLRIAKERSECSIYAYCLMSNHIHLLIAEGKESIGRTMNRLGSAYAYWFNRKYDRVGHLFQGRFHSEPINVDTYLLTALRYIHQNPVKAGLARNCSTYAWTSYHDYMNSHSAKSLTDTKLGLNIVGGFQQFAEFHQKSTDDKLLDIDDVSRITDVHAEQLIKQVLINRTSDDLLKMPIAERNNLLRKLKSLPGVTNRQIESVTGLSRSMVQRA